MRGRGWRVRAVLVVSVVAAMAGTGPAAAGPAGPAVAAAVDDPVAVAADPVAVVLPLAGPPTVLVPFGHPEHRYAAGHRGVDLAGPPGAAVLAPAGGVVTFAGPVAGRPVVTVRHDDGLRSSVEPVLGALPVGTRVSRGAVLGTLVGPGHPACAPASCLHWGVRLPDGTHLDPLALVDGWPVRLWPWDR